MLLAKAQSTTSESEALALVQRCYELLADIINASQEANPNAGARRRERRRVNDRRRLPERPTANSDGENPAPSPGTTAIGRYDRATTETTRGQRGVDVAL